MPQQNSENSTGLFSWLSGIATAKAKKVNRLGNIWEHDVAERLKLRRQQLAKATGVGDDYDVGTYPEVKEDTNINVNQTGGGFVKGALIGAALLAGGGAATIGLISLLNRPTEKVIETPGKTTVITEPGKTRDWGVGKAKVQ